MFEWVSIVGFTNIYSYLLTVLWVFDQFSQTIHNFPTDARSKKWAELWIAVLGALSHDIPQKELIVDTLKPVYFLRIWYHRLGNEYSYPTKYNSKSKCLPVADKPGMWDAWPKSTNLIRPKFGLRRQGWSCSVQTRRAGTPKPTAKSVVHKKHRDGYLNDRI